VKSLQRIDVLKNGNTPGDFAKALRLRVVLLVVCACLVPFVVEYVGLRGGQSVFLGQIDDGNYRGLWQNLVVLAGLSAGIFLLWRALGFSFGLVLVCAVYVPAMFFLMGLCGLALEGGI
jgi:hypothetical protein